MCLIGCTRSLEKKATWDGNGCGMFPFIFFFYSSRWEPWTGSCNLLVPYVRPVSASCRYGKDGGRRRLGGRRKSDNMMVRDQRKREGTEEVEGGVAERIARDGSFSFCWW